ncbi:MAG: ATP-binding protein [Candidatus Methanoplasma sp.]|jgi:magnesium chelatase subunit D|nr:ATP-binding protein [Candidatus Methanoplasma sp.]
MSPGVLNGFFPFSAIKGMDDVKRALECAAADDGMTGVLIKGPTGTAKSLLVRSFVSMLPGKNIVNVPSNVTDEQLFGGMDIENAVKYGKVSIKDGLLQRADGNILYIDNINLFDQKMLNSIMECVESERVIVEREGISAEYSCKTAIIATMDPAEQPIPDSIADSFDICVQTYSARKISDRFKIAEMSMEFDADSEGFMERFAEADEVILKRVASAREKLHCVPVTREDISKISQICINLNARGHRGDISMARVSRILAALDGRDRISDKDIMDAAVLCLLHRRDATREKIITTQKAELPETEEREEEKYREQEPEMVSTVRAEYDAAEGDEDEIIYNGCGIEDLGMVSDITDAVRNRLDSMDEIESIRLHKIAGSSGRRNSITSRKRSGRYRGFKLPDGRSSDPAFDATVRAAAPYQKIRDSKGLSISIEPQDIRDKIRVRRDSCSFMFAVDVSGSLVNSGMMNDIKNGVKAMLMDSYVQRDKVALMTFRSGEVKISVPFTRSMEGVFDTLDSTETGGGTPLGPALLMIREYLLNYIRKNPEERCYVILITDGEATNPVIRGKEASIELKKVAGTMNIRNTEWIVVDSSLIPGKINHALNLARMLGGKYLRLEDLGSI